MGALIVYCNICTCTSSPFGWMLLVSNSHTTFFHLCMGGEKGPFSPTHTQMENKQTGYVRQGQYCSIVQAGANCCCYCVRHGCYSSSRTAVTSCTLIPSLDLLKTAVLVTVWAYGIGFISLHHGNIFILHAQFGSPVQSCIVHLVYIYVH